MTRRHLFRIVFATLIAIASSLQTQTTSAFQNDPIDKKQLEPKVLPKQIFLYASRAKKITPVELSKLSGTGALEITKRNGDDWESATIRWEGQSITIDNKSDRKFLLPHLDGLSGYILQRLADNRMDSHVFHLIRQVNRTNHTYAFKSTKRIQGEPSKFVSRFAQSQNSVLFDGIGFLDPNLQILLGPNKEREELAKLPSFPSAQARKSKSMASLAKRKLKPLDVLPVIVADEEVRLRSATQIARRCLCLLAVAAHAESADSFNPIEFLKRNDAWDAASPAEKQFLENKQLTPEVRSEMTWRYESLTMLLWTIGKVDSLSFPDAQSDAATAISAVMNDTKTFVKSAKLRPTNEILDQADMIYRSFWLVKDAQINSKPLIGLNGSVVHERHYALCWLLRYMNKEWDDVTPDS